MMFVIDGVELRSDAPKEWSGTHADLRKKGKPIEPFVAY